MESIPRQNKKIQKAKSKLNDKIEKIRAKNAISSKELNQRIEYTRQVDASNNFLLNTRPSSIKRIRLEKINSDQIVQHGINSFNIGSTSTVSGPFNIERFADLKPVAFIPKKKILNKIRSNIECSDSESEKMRWS